MKKFMLATTALGAVIALAAAAPAFAGGGGSGDDSATITQVGETGGLATQHQPGDEGNTAVITQEFGSGDVATQEQWRNNNGVDFAVLGVQTIFQELNSGALAHQEDNGDGGDNQSILQFDTVGSTNATQTINAPFGSANTQIANQEFDDASSVNQTIGLNPFSSSAADTANFQEANQLFQTDSSISQVIDGGNDNVELALQSNSGNSNSISATITNASNFNFVNQTQLGTNNLFQTALITSGSNSNSITQLQNGGSSSELQTASIVGSSNNLVDQLQDTGSSVNTQVVSITGGSNVGRALQYQGVNVFGGSQTIIQTGPAFNNQAGQGQGNDFNTALAQQLGGSGNVALQNQGLLPGQTGFMTLSGSTVVRTP